MLAYFLIGFGALLVFAGMRQFLNVRRVSSKGVRTQARVVEVREVWRSGADDVRSRMYSPIYAYNDAEGTEHRMPAQTASKINRFSVGHTKQVIYDPDDPSNVLNSGLTPYLAVILMLALGALVIVLGAWGVLHGQSEG
jgi:hypothetical protein